jgi:tellurite methyltransferase
LSAPSGFFRAELPRLREAARLGPVLDLACGRGRHALAAARAGIPLLGIDRNAEFLRELVARARSEYLPLCGVRADLEAGTGIPVRAGTCGAVLVFRFLFRPLAAQIAAALAPGGLLLYETFTTRQRDLGHGPSNPAFLLRPGELPGLFAGLEVLAHWEGIVEEDKVWAVARLLARRPADSSREPQAPGSRS